MKKPASRILCVLLSLVMLVSAITGVAEASLLTAKASQTFFSPASGQFYEAKGTTKAQGMEVFKLAAAQTTPAIASKLYDILFRAQYRVTDFGGSMWCNANYNGAISSVNDSVLGGVYWGWSARGCFSYAMFVSQYTRNGIGTGNKQRLYHIPTATELKNFLAAYADPGEHIHFYYDSYYGEHSVIYLAGTEDGFYFLSENGNSLDIRLYYASYAYFTSIMNMCDGESIILYSTNATKDPPTDPDSIVIPYEPDKISSITASNGHTYTFYTGADSYKKAASYANEIGGYLATVTSAEEQAIVNTLLKNAPVPFAWMGLHVNKGEYRWGTGEKFLYQNFYTDDKAGAQGFLFTDSLYSGTYNGKWATCGDSYTTDGKTYSQKDSFGFIVETGVIFPTTLIKVSETLDGLSHYTAFDGGFTYKEAQEFCESIGGHLVTIESAEELTTIMNMQKTTGSNYMLGATMVGEAWTWMDNTPMLEGITLPVAKPDSHLIILVDENGVPCWHTTNDTELNGFICEVNLSSYTVGDVNKDDDITTADSREIMRYAVGLSQNIDVQIFGDADGNSKIDVSDARLVLRAAVGLVDWKDWDKIVIDESEGIF